MIIIIIVMFVGRFLWRITIFRASSKIEANLRQEMFIKAEKLPVSYYHENPVGNIMSWFTNDLENIEEFFKEIILFCFFNIYSLYKTC